MTKKILIIDDIRADGDINIDVPRFPEGLDEPTESVLIARTFTLGKRALQLLGPWDELYLDHDLGDHDGKTGYDVVSWIEEQIHEYRFDLMPKKLVCISSNPSGKKRIEQAWEAIQDKLPDLMDEYYKRYKEYLDRGYE
jgi:hypothetical protein